MSFDYQLAVIGGGPGGYVAAIRAAQLGVSVCLIEKGEMGGTCLNVGCIPTKALVQAATLYENIRGASAYGIKSTAELDMPKVIARKNRIVRQLSKGTEQLVAANGVTILKGTASLVSEHEILVQGEEERRITAANIIIASGSVPADLRVEYENKGNVLTSTEALDLEEVPKRMVIVGGGVIGMEFAFIMAGFGTDVTVIEYLPEILATLDSDVIAELMRQARRKRIKVLTNTAVVGLEDTGDLCRVRYQNNETKDETEIEADKVLLSVGRHPYYAGLGVEELGIKLNERWRGIAVNERMQTSIPHIYAIGDVNNIMQLAHVASHQGIVAAENVGGLDSVMNYRAVPSAIFTNPEIATVGLTEKQAEKENIAVKTGTFPYSASGKALVMGARDGFVKVIAAADTEKILGAAIIGLNATDLIAEMSLAVQNELTLSEVATTIHAHPTTAEVMAEAVLDAQDKAIHFYRPK